MQGSPSRLPWSREFLLVFGIVGCSPIKLRGNRFVAVGHCFSIFVSLLAAWFALHLIDVFVSVFAPAFFTLVLNSSIGAELSMFVSFLYTLPGIINTVFLTLLIFRKGRIAAAFNLLHEFRIW